MLIEVGLTQLREHEAVSYELMPKPYKKLISVMKIFCNKSSGIVVEEIAGTNTEEDTTIGTESLVFMNTGLGRWRRNYGRFNHLLSI